MSVKDAEAKLEVATKAAAAAKPEDKDAATTALLDAARELEAARKVNVAALREAQAQERGKIEGAITADLKQLVGKYQGDVKRLGGVLRTMLDTGVDPLLWTASIGSKTEPRKGGGGTGRQSGVSMQRFGKPLAAVFEDVATAEERAELAAVDPNAKRPDAIAHQIKKRAVDRAVTEGKLVANGQ